MMVYILVNLSGQRIRLLDNSLTPAFEYPSQALKYAENHGMMFVKIKKV